MKASFLGTLMAVIAGDSGTSPTPDNLMQQIYTSNAADPSAITPANPNIGNWWYQDPGAPGATGTNFWSWSVINQAWAQISA